MAASIGAMLALGPVLLLAGLRRVERPFSTADSTGLWRKATFLWSSWSVLRRIWVVGSVVAGVVVAVATGWLIGIVLVPLALLGIPALLSEPPQHEIATLAGLDRWIRLLAPSIATGKSIRDAILATRTQAPAILREPVARLVARVDQGWTTKEALLAMADDLSCADADAVLAALAISSSRGGVGTRTTLAALSENSAERLHSLREISSERAKPRAVVRQVTIITLLVLGGSMLLGGNFFEPYRTPVGQALALALAAAYVGALVMLRRRTIPEPAARFLRSSPR
ncbi:MAG: type II secretion system F family protein [Propionibacteriaceae bacterium]|nr:type II secretion system F family protein [Propionibacteriaceae bacterium]